MTATYTVVTAYQGGSGVDTRVKDFTNAYSAGTYYGEEKDRSGTISVDGYKTESEPWYPEVIY